MTIEPDSIELQNLPEPVTDQNIMLPTGSTATPKPRLWTVLVTVIATALLFIAASVGSVALMAIIYMINKGTGSEPDLKLMLSEFIDYPGGAMLILLPGQLAILTGTIIATLLSPEKFAQRLALTTPKWPIAITLAAVLAAPMVSLLWSIPLSSFVSSSEHLETLSHLFKKAGEGLGIITLFLCVAIAPAIAEEFLFRGYIQSRLLKRWHPLWAILLSSLLFASFHADPVHIIAVLPLGIWLGIMTYASGSIIPAMLAHAYNNALSIFGVVYLQADALDSSPFSTLNLIILSTGAVGLLGALGWMNFRRSQEPETIAMS